MSCQPLIINVFDVDTVYVQDISQIPKLYHSQLPFYPQFSTPTPTFQQILNEYNSKNPSKARSYIFSVNGEIIGNQQSYMKAEEANVIVSSQNRNITDRNLLSIVNDMIRSNLSGSGPTSSNNPPGNTGSSPPNVPANGGFNPPTKIDNTPVPSWYGESYEAMQPFKPEQSQQEQYQALPQPYQAPPQGAGFMPQQAQFTQTPPPQQQQQFQAPPPEVMAPQPQSMPPQGAVFMPPTQQQQPAEMVVTPQQPIPESVLISPCPPEQTSFAPPVQFSPPIQQQQQQPQSAPPKGPVFMPPQAQYNQVPPTPQQQPMQAVAFSPPQAAAAFQPLAQVSGVPNQSFRPPQQMPTFQPQFAQNPAPTFQPTAGPLNDQANYQSAPIDQPRPTFQPPPSVFPDPNTPNQQRQFTPLGQKQVFSSPVVQQPVFQPPQQFAPPQQQQQYQQNPNFNPPGQFQQHFGFAQQQQPNMPQYFNMGQMPNQQPGPIEFQQQQSKAPGQFSGPYDAIYYGVGQQRPKAFLPPGQKAPTGPTPLNANQPPMYGQNAKPQFRPPH